MRNLRLYPEVKVKQQSFKGAKVHTLPMQSMTLREIIIRFTRREALPVEKQGVYIDNMGDLEKAQREDITVRLERAEALKEKIAKGKAAAAERKKAVESAASNAQTPQGSVTGSVGAVQAPPASPTPAAPAK